MPSTLNTPTTGALAIKKYLPLVVRRAIVEAGPYTGGRNAAGKCPLDVATKVMFGKDVTTVSGDQFGKRHASAVGSDRTAVSAAAREFIQRVDSGRNGDGSAFDLHRALKIRKPSFDGYGRRID